MDLPDEVYHLQELHQLTLLTGWHVSYPISSGLIGDCPLDRLLQFAVTFDHAELDFDRRPVIEWLKRQMRNTGPKAVCRKSQAICDVDMLSPLDTAIRYLSQITCQVGWSEDAPIPATLAAMYNVTPMLCYAIIHGDRLECDPIPVIEWLTSKIVPSDYPELAQVFCQCTDLRYLKPVISRLRQTTNAIPPQLCSAVWQMIMDTPCHHGTNCVRPECTLTKCVRCMFRFVRAGISVGWVGAMAIMEHDPDLRSTSMAVMQAMDHVLLMNPLQTEWLRIHGLHAEFAAAQDGRAKEYRTAFVVIIRADLPAKLHSLVSWMYGPSYLVHHFGVADWMLRIAADCGSIDVIGDILLKAAARLQRDSPAARIPPISFDSNLLQRCLGLLIENPSGRTHDTYLTAAIQCGADYVPLHDQLLRQFPRDPAALHDLGIDVILDRVNGVFWSMMADQNNDLRAGCHLLWDHYSSQIQPRGIFQTVARQLPATCSKSIGSRWWLAFQIDPAACCYVANHMDLDRTVIDLMTLQGNELDQFLDRFPVAQCFQCDHATAIPEVSLEQDSLLIAEARSSNRGHRLDLFAHNSLAMIYAIRNHPETAREQIMSAVQSLMAAATRNAIETEYASYHLCDQMLLVIDSAVVQSTENQETRASVMYCGLNVTGINLYLDVVPTTNQVISACQRCVTLTEVIWRKQQAQNDAALSAMRAELSRASQ